MRLETNFAPRMGWSVPWLMAASLVLLVICLSLLLWMHGDRTRAQSQLEDLPNRLTELQARLDALPPGAGQALSAAELASLREEVTAVNALAGISGRPPLLVLALLEQLLPDDVRLTMLHHRARIGEITLVAESGRHGVLTEFLERLEAEPGFAEVMLLRQGRVENRGAEQAFQFEIRVVEAAGD